jgi:two-component system OmpR family response regulator
VRVLVAEDESRNAKQLTAALSQAGYAVDCAADGERADFLGQTEQYDAVILDLGLPRMDGLTVLRRWRDAGLTMPVLVLTARGSWHEKVHGIDAGADDYVAKPFRIEEVLARLRALIRRSSGQLSAEIRCGPIALDPRAARVTVTGTPVRLTSHEFRVLSYLMHHRGRVVSQSELSDHIYAEDADRDSNTVEVFIARLRRKVGAASIETVRGLGYRMAGEQAPR